MDDGFSGLSSSVDIDQCDCPEVKLILLYSFQDQFYTGYLRVSSQAVASLLRSCSLMKTLISRYKSHNIPCNDYTIAGCWFILLSVMVSLISYFRLSTRSLWYLFFMCNPPVDKCATTEAQYKWAPRCLLKEEQKCNTKGKSRECTIKLNRSVQAQRSIYCISKPGFCLYFLKIDIEIAA